MLKGRSLTVKVSSPVMSAMEMTVVDRHDTLSERIDDIADWFNRVKEQKGDYSLGELTINTLMDCVGDLIVIARYYRKASACDEEK